MLFSRSNNERPVASPRRAENSERGFSLIEIMLVAVVMMIIAALAVWQLRPSRELYRSDDEAQQIVETLRLASQLSLTNRQSMRVELNASQKWIRIVDENDPTTAADDVERMRVNLENVATVKVDAQPTGIGLPTPPAYTLAAWTGSGSNKLWTLRYRLDGTVERTNGNVTNATLFIYPPDAANVNRATNNKLIRAITIFGGTGSIKLWKYSGSQFISY